MIHILFVPGSFGSTVNLVVQSFCKNIKLPALSLEESVLSDGSAHSYYKRGHWHNKELLLDFMNGKIDQDLEISTPVYPYPDMTVQEVFSQFQNKRSNDKVVLVYVDDINHAELNVLAQYYKISKGKLNRGLGIFYFDDHLEDIKKWNKGYSSFKDMHPWEFREFFSLYYHGWIKCWVEAPLIAPNNWLKVSTNDILINSRETFIKICNFVDKFDNTKTIELYKFLDVWLKKQEYLIKELELVNKIVNAVVNQKIMSWDRSQICILSEAMIQKKLRDYGYDLQCAGLDTFPINSIQLYKLLEKR